MSELIIAAIISTATIWTIGFVGYFVRYWLEQKRPPR